MHRRSRATGRIPTNLSLLGLLLMALACAGTVSAAGFESRFLHQGDISPASTGWTFSGIYPGTPVASDQGLPAWNINDPGTASGNLGAYTRVPTAADLARARKNGWRLRGVLRQIPPTSAGGAILAQAPNLSVTFEVGDGQRRWPIAFGNQAGTGNTQLDVGGTIHTLSAPGYHLVELVYIPQTNAVDVVVDGVTLASNWSGATTTLSRVLFGSGSSATVGQANYHLVEWLVGIPDCSDGIDNDGDGVVDLADHDCFAADDPTERTLAPMPGDIAMLQYRFDTDDGFGFVVLSDLSGDDPTTPDVDERAQIQFTDEGWDFFGLRFDNDRGEDRTEHTWTWTAPAAGVRAGTVVNCQIGCTTGTILAPTGVDPDPSIQGEPGESTSNIINLSNGEGEQLFAFRGDRDRPVPLYAFNQRPWVALGGAVDKHESELPVGLVNGDTAISLNLGLDASGNVAGEADNGRMRIRSLTGTPAQIRAVISNPANWDRENSSTFAFQPPSYWTVNVIPDLAPRIEPGELGSTIVAYAQDATNPAVSPASGSSCPIRTACHSCSMRRSRSPRGADRRPRASSGPARPASSRSSRPISTSRTSR